jgi:hypothetical protein
LGEASTAGVRLRALELQGHYLLVAEDPCVVIRFDDVGVPRPDVRLGSVVVDDVKLAGNDR